MKRLRLEYGYPVEKMSNVFDVSKSGYYAWLLRRPSKRQKESARLETVIKAAHERGRGTYAPERLQEELAKVDGVNIGRDKLKRVRRKLGIRCKQVRKFKATTNSKHKLPIADNLLEHNFASNRPGEV
jgi:putative transposase